MRRHLFSASEGKHYRRGAVMGLTVAEVLMLVAFVLLLLLLFWRQQVQDAVDLAAKLPPESRHALLKGAVPIRPERLAELEAKEQQLADTEQLLEKPLQRALAELAAELPPETLRKLTDLAREPDTVAAADALLKGAVPIRPERLAELERKERLTAEHNAAEIADALELRNALDPYREDSNRTLLDRVGNLQARENAIDSRLAEEAQAAHYPQVTFRLNVAPRSL